ncbi:hypothetical protein C8R42DRAFT_558675, partial [Lentinula raphanica]
MFNMYDSLAAMGHPIPESTFVSYVKLSLPPSYQMIATNVSASIAAVGQTLTINTLLAPVYEEFDNRLALRNAKNETENAAMIGGSSLNSKGGNESSRKEDLVCDNCKKKGHKTSQCFGPGGAREGQAPWQKKGKKGKKEAKSANLAEAPKAEENFAFSASAASVRIENPSPSASVHTFSICGDVEVNEAHKSQGGTSEIEHGKIIDSGASSHFTPDRKALVRYVEIEPEPICAADGRTFTAVGKGDMVVTL